MTPKRGGRNYDKAAVEMVRGGDQCKEAARQKIPVLCVLCLRGMTDGIDVSKTRTFLCWNRPPITSLLSTIGASTLAIVITATKSCCPDDVPLLGVCLFLGPVLCREHSDKNQNVENPSCSPCRSRFEGVVLPREQNRNPKPYTSLFGGSLGEHTANPYTLSTYIYIHIQIYIYIYIYTSLSLSLSLSMYVYITHPKPFVLG